VVEQVTGVGVDALPAGEGAVDHVQRAVQPDEDGPGDVVRRRGRPERETRAGRDRDDEGDDADPVRRQPQAVDPRHERVEHAVQRRTEPVECHAR